MPNALCFSYKQHILKFKLFGVIILKTVKKLALIETLTFIVKYNF